MISRRFISIAVLGLLSIASFPAHAADAIYSNDFEKTEIGKLPENTMVLSGDFAVREEGGKKFLELPGAPLETFGLLFGPAQAGEVSASGTFLGTKQGRKFPAFGISLGGVSGYRLEMSGGKKALELFKGDDSRATVPFEWTSGEWTNIRLQLRKTATGTHVEGKAWPVGKPEPVEWAITLDDAGALPNGRAAIWGTPYAGTPICFDDLRIEAAK